MGTQFKYRYQKLARFSVWVLDPSSSRGNRYEEVSSPYLVVGARRVGAFVVHRVWPNTRTILQKGEGNWVCSFDRAGVHIATGKTRDEAVDNALRFLGGYTDEQIGAELTRQEVEHVRETLVGAPNR